MKIKIVLPLFAAIAVIGLAIATTAFGNNKEKKNSKKLVNRHWVLKSGVDPSDGDARILPSNYELANGDGTAITCSSGQDRLCQIFAAETGGSPNLPLIPDESELQAKLYNDDEAVPLQMTNAIFLRANP